jgi:hypothetical protein
VAVLEDVRRDLHPVAERSLERVAPAVDLRPDILDLDAGRGLLAGGWGHASVTFSDDQSVNSDR